MSKRQRSLSGDRDRDQIRKQWSSMTLSEKWSYIWFYYKAVVVAVVILLAFALFFGRDIATKNTETAFYVMVLDSELTEEETKQLEDALLEALGLSGEDAECVIESGYSSESSNAQSEATISAYMQSGRVDLGRAPEEKFNTYATTGYLAALDQEAYAELLAQVKEQSRFWAELYDFSEGGAVTELPMNPHEETEDACCYGIYLSGETFPDMVLGVMANAPHEDLLLSGLTWFLDLP